MSLRLRHLSPTRPLLDTVVRFMLLGSRRRRTTDDSSRCLGLELIIAGHSLRTPVRGLRRAPERYHTALALGMSSRTARLGPSGRVRDMREPEPVELSFATPLLRRTTSAKQLGGD